MSCFRGCFSWLNRFSRVGVTAYEVEQMNLVEEFSRANVTDGAAQMNTVERFSRVNVTDGTAQMNTVEGSSRASVTDGVVIASSGYTRDHEVEPLFYRRLSNSDYGVGNTFC